MALIVTPGASNADAFASYATVAAYATANGLTFTETEVDGEAPIRRATTWLSNGWSWRGYKANGRSQSLAWPRAGVEDAEGNAVDPEEIPVEIVNACCEAAIYEFGTPGGLAPVIVMADRIKSERVGPISTEYVVGYSASASRPILTVVSDMVSGLLSAGASSLAGSSVRS